MDDLQQYAAPGTSVAAEMVATRPNVSLRCIRFTPALRQSPITIVFVPGWTSLLNSWRYFLPILTSTFPLIYIETHEKPTSILTPPYDLSVSAISDDIVRLIDYFDVPDHRYALVGSSLGATTILEAAPHLPRYPLCLALILPNAYFPVPLYTPLLRVIPSALLPPLKRLVQWAVLRFKIDPEDPGHQEQFIAAVTAADTTKLKLSALAIHRYRLDLSRLSAISYPSLVVGASKDRIHVQSAILDVAKALSASEYHDLSTFTASHGTAAAHLVVSYINRIYSSDYYAR